MEFPHRGQPNMKRILIASALAFSLSALATATSPGDLTARMEVKTGRAQVIQKGQPAQSIRQGENVSLEGKAHLEVPAGSEVRVSYPGQASLMVWGPASLDWQVQGPQSSIHWNVFKVTWCDLEVRQGVHQLNLPGDWVAKVDGGSLRLRGLASGPLEMRLNAGRPVQVSWVGEKNQARPPLTILPGSNIRLEQPSRVPVDQSGKGSKWDQPSWPYRRNAETSEENQARTERPEQLDRAPAWPLPPVPVQEQPEEVSKGNTQNQLGETKAQVSWKPEIKNVFVQPVTPSQGQKTTGNQVMSPGVGKVEQVDQASPKTPVTTKVDFQTNHWRHVAKEQAEGLQQHRGGAQDRRGDPRVRGSQDQGLGGPLGWQVHLGVYAEGGLSPFAGGCSGF